MKLSDFKVGDKVRLPGWGQGNHIEILYLNQKNAFARSYTGQEWWWAIAEYDDWEPYVEPKASKANEWLNNNSSRPQFTVYKRGGDEITVKLLDSGYIELRSVDGSIVLEQQEAFRIANWLIDVLGA